MTTQQLKHHGMSPSELGQVIAKRLDLKELPSAQKVNQALQDSGLQTSETSLDSQVKKELEFD